MSSSEPRALECGCGKDLTFAQVTRKGEESSREFILAHVDGTEACVVRPIPYVPGNEGAFGSTGRYLCHHGNDGETCERCGLAHARLKAELDQADGEDRVLGFPWAMVICIIGLYGFLAWGIWSLFSGRVLP